LSDVPSQKKLSVALIIFLIFLCLLLYQINSQLGLTLGLGLAIGFTLQKSRFCFVAAMRDPLLLGLTELTQAVILLIGLSTVGFAAIILYSSHFGIVLDLYVMPFGIHTVVGGVIFGVGMVLAGGCTSGILMRMGEGFVMQWIAFGSLFIGAFVGGRTVYLWRNVFGEHEGIFLPDIIGWIPALALELIVLIVLWFFARWWQQKKCE